MSSSHFSEAEIVIFWNLDQCPIPNDLSLALTYANIKLAIKNMGYTGTVSTIAYSDTTQIKQEFDLLNIKLRTGYPLKTYQTMPRHVRSWWVDEHRDEPTNLMVISKECHYLYNGFAYLNTNENNLLLAHPCFEYQGVNIPHTASSVWLWSSLSTGGSPFHSKIETPSPAFSDPKTGVFWDLDDCPIPNYLSVASVYANIKFALTNIGYNGSVSIVAYSLAEQIKEEFDLVNIKLIHPESSKEKAKMMLMEVYMWGIEHRGERTNLLVISEDISQDNDLVSALVSLSKKDNNLLLAHTQNTSGVLLHSASSIWLWSSLSTGESPQVASTSQKSSSCKKRLRNYCLSGKPELLRLAFLNKQKKRRTKRFHDNEKSKSKSSSPSSRESPLDDQIGSLQVASPSQTSSPCEKRSLRLANKQKKHRTKPSHEKEKSKSSS